MFHATQDVISEEVDCPPTMVGRLIGKGGETIKSLEANNGAKIQIDQDTKKVSVTGAPANVASCVAAINELLTAPGETMGGYRAYSHSSSYPLPMLPG